MKNNQIDFTYLNELKKNLPDEFFTAGQIIKKKRDRLCFEEGDFANNIFDHFNNKAIAITRLGAAFLAAELTGDQTRTHTIYNYSKVASRILDVELRETFAVLPFSHLEYASQHEEMETILNVDLQLLAETGNSHAPSLKNIKDAVENAQDNNEPLSKKHFNMPPPKYSILTTLLQILKSLQAVYTMASKTLPENQKLQQLMTLNQELITELQAEKNETE